MRKHKLQQILKKYNTITKEKESKRYAKSSLTVEESLALDIINIERKMDVLVEALAVISQWIIMVEDVDLVEWGSGGVRARKLKLGGR